MRILDRPVSAMYSWTILLLLLMVVVSSYTLRIIPYSAMAAVAATLLIEAALVKYYLKVRLRLPLPALITGLLISMIAPQNAPLLLIVLAAAAAEFSKFFIKFKSSILLNPTAFGLLIALPMFHLGDTWWASSSYNVLGMILSLSPLLIVAAYYAKRLPTSISFMSMAMAIGLILGGVGHMSVSGLDSLLFSINYLFAFVMIADPKTSPIGITSQIIYGAGLAALVFALGFAGAPYPFLVALLVGNLAYALYRNRHILYWTRTRRAVHVLA